MVSLRKALYVNVDEDKKVATHWRIKTARSKKVALYNSRVYLQSLWMSF